MVRSRGRQAGLLLSGLAALAALPLVATAPLAAQDGEIDIVGSAAVITVISGSPDQDAGEPGNGGGGTGWRYSCLWLDTWAGADVGLGPAERLIEGTRYHVTCTSMDAPPATHPNLDGVIIVYNPADPIADAVDSVELANAARNQAQAQPPALPVGLSPTDRQITGVTTWLWPDGPTEFVEAEASAGGLTVTVRGIYQQTAFDVGEAGVDLIVCEDAVAWSLGASEPTCSHTYLTESPARIVTAESEWLYVWRDNQARPQWAAWESVRLVEEQVVEVIDLEAVISGNG